MHLLCGPVSAADLPPPRAAGVVPRDREALEARVEQLEAELGRLRDRLDRLAPE